MRHAIFCLTLLGFLVSEIGMAQTTNSSWLKRAGGSDEDIATSLTIDGSGNVYIAGVAGRGKFDGITVNPVWPGSSDIVVAKYHADGTIEWVRNFGGTGNHRINSIAADERGTTYLTGSFSDNKLVFDHDTLRSIGGPDMFMACLGPDGTCKWARGIGGYQVDEATGIAVDNAGNVYLTGTTQSKPSDELRFDNLTFAKTDASNDSFIARYDSNGTAVWVKGITGLGSEVSNGITVARSGNIYLTGRIGLATYFDEVLLLSTASRNVFLAQFHPDGSVGWVQPVCATDNQTAIVIGPGVAVDSMENIYLTGSFLDTLHFNSSALLSAGLGDIFVARYHSNGNIEWAKQAGGEGADQGTSIAVGQGGKVYVTGTIGGTQVFVASYGNDGETAWTRRSVGKGGYGASGAAIGTNTLGEVYVTGIYTGPESDETMLSFDGTPLLGFGGRDIFLWNIDDNIPQSSVDEESSPTGAQGAIVKITPNPMSGEGAIEIETVESGRTHVAVIDMLGREVAVVFDGELTHGRHLLPIATRTWTTGSYLLRLQTPTVVQTTPFGILR